MNTYYIFMGTIVFMCLSIVVGIFGGIIYLIYLPIKNRLIKSGKLTPKKSKRINLIYITLLLFFSAYQTYDAFFPSENFYEEEFKTVTLREISKSAEFISKKSSYPDFHGDYCSSSQIKLSKEDYQKLLTELNSDNQFTKNEQSMGFEEFFHTLGNKTEKKFTTNFKRKIKGKEDHYLFIAFYYDKQTIFVNICVT